jgi:hypothetical protein
VAEAADHADRYIRIVDAHTGELLRDLPSSFADVRWLSGQRLRKLCGQRLSGESHKGTIG